MAARVFLRLPREAVPLLRRSARLPSAERGREESREGDVRQRKVRHKRELDAQPPNTNLADLTP